MHHIDKHKIFATLYAATREIDRLQQDQEARIRAIEERLGFRFRGSLCPADASAFATAERERFRMAGLAAGLEESSETLGIQRCKASGGIIGSDRILCCK